LGISSFTDFVNLLSSRLPVSRRSINREVLALLHANSVTMWIDGIKAGDGSDIRRLWDRYIERLVRLAGARLPAQRRRSFDEEDVALSAFQSLCDRAGRGQFPRMSGRDDLALRRLEGRSAREIAQALEVSTKTVERKPQLIRAIWIQESSR
jgi:ECF sigma factor